MSIKRGNAKWKFEYAIECKVKRDFAWQFWTNVNNWPVVDSSLEAVKLHGPFAAGTRGTTKPCGHGPVEWQLTEVQNGSGAVVAIPVPGAVLICVWSFEDAVSGGTRIKQQARIEGDRAEDYLPRIGQDLELGIPAGMRSLAEAINSAATERCLIW